MEPRLRVSRVGVSTMINPVRHYRNSGWAGMEGAAAVVGAVAILYLARDTLIPLAYAITLALILSPLVGWLRKHGLNRVPAAMLVMALAIVSVTGASLALPLEWWRGSYHFVRPHRSLRVALPASLARRGCRWRRRHRSRTPAMAAGLTRRRWTAAALLAVPCGPAP